MQVRSNGSNPLVRRRLNGYLLSLRESAPIPPRRFGESKIQASLSSLFRFQQTTPYTKSSLHTMSATALRCVLVYRLEKGDNAVCLAKYDHTYEASGGSVSGRDDAFAEAVQGIISNDPPAGLSESNKIGGFKVVQSDEHQVTYGCDKGGVCCAVITGNAYQSRVAIGCLNELYSDFMAKFAKDTKSAAPNSLSKKAKSILKAVSEKYEDPSKVDKTSKILGQVDAVKGKMQSNIATMLKNTEKAESMNEKSAQLNEQASVFKKRSTDLKKTMRWKNLKMTLLLAAVCIAIACAIIIPLVSKAKSIAGQ